MSIAKLPIKEAEFVRTTYPIDHHDDQVIEPVVSVIGLGYVGTVSTACFANLGFQLIGVDTDLRKVQKVGKGTSPIVEKGLGRLLFKGVQCGLVSTCSQTANAVRDSDITLICVGTPSSKNGNCDTSQLKQVCKDIGAALFEKKQWHTVVFRSTIPPGTTRQVLIPIIEGVSRKTAGVDFGVAFHPEFLRESTAIEDFFEPPKTVIGADDAETIEQVSSLYKDMDVDVIATSLETAEMVKYVDNTWHATKVCFANEVGKIAKALGIDSHEVMDVFVTDTKLNISSYYMKPGFAFGGSCLPKDVRGMNQLAASLDVATPVLNSLTASNDSQIYHALDLVRKNGVKQVGILGLTFKPGTDDLRESPILILAGLLADEGIQLKIHDPNLCLNTSARHHVKHSKASRRWNGLEEVLEKLPSLMCSDLKEITDTSEVIVLAHNDPDYIAAIRRRPPNCRVVDLARGFKILPFESTYEGICW